MSKVTTENIRNIALIGHGGEGKTRMKQMKLHLRDLRSSLIVLIICGGNIALHILL